MVYDLAHWKEPRKVIGWDLTENQYQLEGVSHAIEIARSLNLPWSKMKSSTILDFGCGTGRVARALSLMFRQVWAYDPQRACVLICPKECQPFKGRLQNLFYTSSLPAKKFDYVCSYGVIEHLNDEMQVKAMHQIFSCLNETGKAFIRWSPWNNKQIAKMVGYITSESDKRVYHGVYGHKDVNFHKAKVL